MTSSADQFIRETPCLHKSQMASGHGLHLGQCNKHLSPFCIRFSDLEVYQGQRSRTGISKGGDDRAGRIIGNIENESSHVNIGRHSREEPQGRLQYIKDLQRYIVFELPEDILILSLNVQRYIERQRGANTMDDCGHLAAIGERPLEASILDGKADIATMDLSQKAIFLATLVLRKSRACGIEELRGECHVFPVSSQEVEAMCHQPGSPLCLVKDQKVGLASNFLSELRLYLEGFMRENMVVMAPSNVGALVPIAHCAQLDNGGRDQALGNKQKLAAPKRIPEFNDYIVEGEEGSGGYGTVYRVKRKMDGQLFAIKCPLEKTTQDYVNHEIKMLKRIGGKEYITKCEEVIFEQQCAEPENGANKNHRPNLVLQYIEHDKPDVLRKEITIPELQAYGYCLFRALAYLHKQGIVHRDVKPGNFLFSRTRGTGYLVDFNLALHNQTATTAEVKDDKLLCNPGAAKGETNIDPNSVPAKKVLGKRARKDEGATTLSKRQQTLSNLPAPIRSPRNIKIPHNNLDNRPPIAGIIRRELISCEKSIIKRAGPVSRVNGGATQLTREEIQKKSVAADSSSKIYELGVPLACGSRHSRRSQKPATTSTEPDGAPASQSVLGELAWMPPTLGVLRYAQYLKHRGQNQATTLNSIPPASQRKRVAALQHKVRVHPRIPMTPPKPSNKGSGVRKNLPKDGPCAGTKGYRAPEVLLKSTMQTTKLDIWSAGVSLLQLIAGKAPFPSSSSEQALRDIAKLRGVDDLVKLAGAHNCLHKIPPGFQFVNDKPLSVMDWCSTSARRVEMRERLPPALYDLLEKCLLVDPDTRIDASRALCHDFFSPIHEKAVSV